MTHTIASILGPLADVRGAKTIGRRLTRLSRKLSGVRFNRRQWKRAFKGNYHDHIDCSVEYATMLDLWDQLYDFNLDNFKFPEGTLSYWKAFNFDHHTLAFPQEIIDAWRCPGLTVPKDRRFSQRDAVRMYRDRRVSRQNAVRLYRDFLVDYGGGTLFQYVQAILVHILPIMQSAKNIERIFRERVRMGIANGEGAAELRGAPQLHTMAGLDMEGALRAYIAGIADSPYPINITVCALRHENGQLAWDLAKLSGKYRDQGVRMFDLAADEESNPGVLSWWIKPAVLASLFGLGLTIHLWETNEPTDDDIRNLNAFDIIVPEMRQKLAAAGLKVEDVLTSTEVEAEVSRLIDEVIASVLAGPIDLNVCGDHIVGRLGHGFRGHRQGSRVCEVCFSSNDVTKQVLAGGLSCHPGHKLFHEEGALLMIATDGTTLIGITGLLDEYVKLQKHGWDAADILVSNMIGIRAASFRPTHKLQLMRQCLDSYEALAEKLGL